MKKIILTLAVLFTCGLFTQEVLSQTTQVEKTYALSGKARRGTLGKVEYINSNYILYYITKTNSKKMKFEVYTFDKDFNFISKTDEELDFEQAKTKYKWFKFGKEEYSVEGLTVEPTMMGTLQLKRKRVTHSFDPILFGYRKKTELLEKVKPKSDDGNKLQYYSHYEDDNTGDVYVLCAEKPKGDLGAIYTKYHIMQFNNQCDLVSDLPLTQEVAMMKVDATKFADLEVSEPGIKSLGDMCFVFAPVSYKGMTTPEDKDKSNFKFIRVNNDNKKVAEFNFSSPSPGWRIDDMIVDYNTNDIYYYGPSQEGKDSYFNNITVTDKTKFKAVQLMKIHDNKFEYMTSTNLEEFEAKLKTPPSQKKAPAYRGKKFKIINYNIAVNGDFVVMGQNFEVKEGISYRDILAFHFDQKGVLRSQFSLDLLESNDVSKANQTPQQFLGGADKNNLYWFVREIDGITDAGRVLTYARIGKINLTDATLSDFKMMGTTGKKPEFFIDPNFPYLATEDPSTIAFFGADKKEKNIWFCRVHLD